MEGQTTDSGLNEPRDWKAFHAENVAKLDAEVREECVAFLRQQLAPAARAVRSAIARDPQEWWVAHHFHWMMSVRNLLREHGFGEKEFGIDNLDDYAVGLVELAMEEQAALKEAASDYVRRI